MTDIETKTFSFTTIRKNRIRAELVRTALVVLNLRRYSGQEKEILNSDIMKSYAIYQLMKSETQCDQYFDTFISCTLQKQREYFQIIYKSCEYS